MDWHCHADAEAGPKPKGSGRGGLTGACLRVIALNASHVMQTKVTHRDDEALRSITSSHVHWDKSAP